MRILSFLEEQETVAIGILRFRYSPKVILLLLGVGVLLYGYYCLRVGVE